MSEWADEHRVLDPLFNAEGGRWRTARAPYAREWMDSASCRWVRQIALLAGTQVGKTETLNNIFGFHIHHSPCPMMLVMPRQVDARLAQQRRIKPMVEASAALRDERTEHARDIKAREMVFRRAILYFRSAQTPADMSGVPVRLVCCDEVDKYPPWSGREASPIKLVQERTRTFYDRLVVLASTPTTRDGTIAGEFEKGDRRRYHVPCPHCSKTQVLRWGQVKWNKEEVTTAQQMKKRREAWYECEHCGSVIDDRQKIGMLELGVWVPEGWDIEAWLQRGRREDRAPNRSYHIWAGYSPWLSWWEIVAEWLASKDDPADLMNFVNSWLAEVWEDRVETTTDAQIEACIDLGRAQFEVPEDVQVLTAAVDVQKDRLEWAVQGWGLDEESWVIAAGSVTTWDDLADVLFRNQWGEGRKLAIRCAMIDSRHRRDEVIDFVRRWRPVARMIAGVDREAPQPFGTVRIEKHPRTGIVLPNALTIWTLQVGWFKDLLAARIQRTAGGDDSRHGQLHLPNDLPDAFLKQLASEQKVRHRRGTKMRSVWVLKPGHVRNEAWDLLVYNVAAARLIRCDLLKSADNPNAPPPPKPPPGRERRGRRPPRYPMLGQ